MTRTVILLISLLLLGRVSFAQNEDDRIEVLGDSLVGRTVNGESIREWRGNVVMTQGVVKITCEKAIQYIARNEAELIGKVVVIQDSITIKTDRGYYYGDTKIAFSNADLFLTDGHVNLNSKNGYYYFDEKRSYFYENVKLNDSLSSLSADRLTYYDDSDKAVAAGNVQVNDSSSTTFADSLIHLRNTKETFAFNNIRIYNPSNRLAIYGNKLEDFGDKNYSKILGNPFLVRIDTTSNGELDTLMISAKLMESFDDSTKRLVATDSVRMVRKNFASVNGQTFYFQDGDKIQTFRRESDAMPPVMWNEETQLVGDSIDIVLKDNRLDWMEIRSNASIITPNKNSGDRFDQISGKNIKLFFGKDGLEKTEAEGSALSIYYMYEDEEPNGLLKSSAERAKIFFKDNTVSDVRFYGKPVSEYHPENVIQGKEKDFTIPTFRIFSNRPTKENLLFNRKDVLSFLIKDVQYYAGKTNPKK
ncbi:MAG: OstA-like protein [Bacteroidota bacterium]